jgi:hypothetical protein
MVREDHQLIAKGNCKSLRMRTLITLKLHIEVIVLGSRRVRVLARFLALKRMGKMLHK